MPLYVPKHETLQPWEVLLGTTFSKPTDYLRGVFKGKQRPGKSGFIIAWWSDVNLMMPTRCLHQDFLGISRMESSLWVSFGDSHRWNCPYQYQRLDNFLNAIGDLRQRYGPRVGAAAWVHPDRQKYYVPADNYVLLEQKVVLSTANSA